MRAYFVENDLISAELQSFHGDGPMTLHTRNFRYGKLENGQFVSVLPTLIKRCKTHFQTLPCGVHVVLGVNGFIFLSEANDSNSSSSSSADRMQVDGNDKDSSGNVEISPLAREKICRVRNCILALAKMFIFVHPPTIMEVYEASKTPLSPFIRALSGMSDTGAVATRYELLVQADAAGRRDSGNNAGRGAAEQVADKTINQSDFPFPDLFYIYKIK